MIAADMLELNDAVSCCTEFLKSEIDSSNAVGLLRFADMHNFTVLHKLSEDFIYGNFVQICEEDELGDLSKDQFIKFLNSEYLCVDSEQQVFRAAMKWIKHDLSDRRRYIFEILSCIRIPLMSIQFLEREINENTDASLRVALRSIYTDIVERIGNLVALQVEPRLGAKKDIYILGGSKREICSAWSRYSESTFESVVKFNTFRKEWCDIKPMNIGRIMPGVAILNGCIYVVGGENESLILSNGECYNPIEDNWTSVAGMTVPRCEFGMAALNGYLYAIGGWVGDDIGGSIEIYSPSLNRWTMCNSVLPEPRFSMGVVSFEGLIYIVGGCTRTKRHLQDLLSYNPVTGEWSILAPMLVPRSQMGVAVLDKHLYVVGGITSNNEVLNLVEQYDFEENTWSFVNPMKGKRASPAVAAADGMLYVIGGDITHTINSYRSQITISTVERYNNSTLEWEDLPSLPESRSEAGVAVL
ncbi:Hypothetical protein CINCED_3A013809 [Cinara cedri]|nr:Hypothetical protein CINCED_3A013809 [Cinara cedri]